MTEPNRLYDFSEEQELALTKSLANCSDTDLREQIQQLERTSADKIREIREQAQSEIRVITSETDKAASQIQKELIRRRDACRVVLRKVTLNDLLATLRLLEDSGNTSDSNKKRIRQALAIYTDAVEKGQVVELPD